MTWVRDSRGVSGRGSNADGPEAGETLVETLVSVSIMGITVVTMLGGLLVLVTSSGDDQDQAQVQNALRNWSEGINQSTYQTCAVAGDFPVPAAVAALGYSGAVTAVGYWNTTTSTFGGTCPPAGQAVAGDQGLQRVTIAITVPASQTAGFTQSLDVIVRNPCNSAGDPGC